MNEPTSSRAPIAWAPCLVALLTLTLLLISACDKPVSPSGAAKGPVKVSRATVVEFASVARQDQALYGDYSGELFADRMAMIAPELAGRVTAVSARLGDTVKADQTLAKLDGLQYLQQVRQYQATVKMAEAQVRAAEVTRDNLDRSYKRLKPLSADKLVAQAELDELEAQLMGATQQVMVAKASLEQQRALLLNARESLGRMQLNAPFAGEVAMRQVEVGQMASPQQALFTIVDMDTLMVRVLVPSEDASAITLGMKATLRFASQGDRACEATVARLSPAVDSVTRALQMELQPDEGCEAEQALRPGVVVRVRVELAASSGALVVPSQAILRADDGTSFVWLLDDGKAQRRAITPGLAGRTVTQVVEGLALDDQVVTRGQEDLIEGMAIAPPRAMDAPNAADAARTTGGAP